MVAVLAVSGWRSSQPRANGHNGTSVKPSRATGTSVWIRTSRFPTRRYGSSARLPSTQSSKRDAAWLSVTCRGSLTGPSSHLGPDTGSRCLRQIPRAKAEFLQAQVVVLLCLADPLHAHAPYHLHRARVGRPHERDDLFDSLPECPPRQRQPSLGGVPVAPRRPVKLPADLEFLVR